MHKRWLTSRPHYTSVQKAASDNENMDAVLRHAQDDIIQYKAPESVLTCSSWFDALVACLTVLTTKPSS